MKDYYAVLNVKPSASQDEIKAQYRKLSKLYHPDVNPGSSDKFADINEAYSIVGDADKRREYMDGIKKEQEAKNKTAAAAQAAARARAANANAGTASPNFSAFGNSDKLNVMVNTIKQQSYKEGYQRATDALSPKITALNNEVSTLRAQIAALESRGRESINQVSNDLSARLKVEMDKRSRAESELSTLRIKHSEILSELESCKQDLDTANDTIIEILDNRQGTPSKDNDNDNDYDYNDEEVKDFWEQFNEDMRLAEEGDPYAQNAVGEYYLNGTGVDVDLKEAVSWFMKSAKSLCPDGLLNLGICYQNGEGIEKNGEYAEFYIRKAAHYGNENAIEFCNEQGWDTELL